MTAAALALLLLVSTPTSLDLRVLGPDGGSPAETITFCASATSESRVRAAETLRVRAHPPKGAWSLRIHTANDSGGRGLRNASDPSLGADILWSRTKEAGQHAEGSDTAWRLMRDPSEPDWSALATSDDVLLDASSPAEPGHGARDIRLEFEALIDRIPAGAYSSRILVDLLCFSEPEPDSPSWVRLLAGGAPDSGGVRAAGNALSLIAVPSRAAMADSASRIRSVLFEYRAEEADAWIPCRTTLWSDRNPDTRPPAFGILWNLSDIAEGEYRVRATARRGDGFTDPAPSVVSVIKSAHGTRVDGMADAGEATFTHRQKFAVGSTDTIALFDGTSVALPAETLCGLSDDARAWLRVTLFGHAPPGLAPPRALLAPPRAFRRFEREDGCHRFRTPATIEIPYAKAELTAPEESLRMYWFDPIAAAWTPLAASRVDTERAVVIGATDHFSDFAIFARAAAAGPRDVIVYPNPWIPDDGRAENGTPFAPGNAASGIIFDGLQPGSSIRLFTVAGGEVAMLSAVRVDGRIQWDARNADGRNVASGMYLASIRFPDGATAVLKLMIVR